MKRKPIEFCIEQLTKLENLDILFHMNQWGNSSSSHPLDVPEDPSCGFAGCFMGWAAHQQWFDRFGVPLRIKKAFEHSSAALTLQVSSPNAIADHAEAIDAVSKMMGIEEHTLDQIILPDNYPMHDSDITPIVVANRLQRLLDSGDELLFVEECKRETEKFLREELELEQEQEK